MMWENKHLLELVKNIFNYAGPAVTGIASVITLYNTDKKSGQINGWPAPKRGTNKWRRSLILVFTIATLIAILQYAVDQEIQKINDKDQGEWVDEQKKFLKDIKSANEALAENLNKSVNKLDTLNNIADNILNENAILGASQNKLQKTADVLRYPIGPSVSDQFIYVFKFPRNYFIEKAPDYSPENLKKVFKRVGITWDDTQPINLSKDSIVSKSYDPTRQFFSARPFVCVEKDTARWSESSLKSEMSGTVFYSMPTFNANTNTSYMLEYGRDSIQVTIVYSVGTGSSLTNIENARIYTLKGLPGLFYRFAFNLDPKYTSVRADLEYITSSEKMRLYASFGIARYGSLECVGKIQPDSFVPQLE